ncbi:hypothetical protein D3C76_1026730 [compost metagenome]
MKSPCIKVCEFDAGVCLGCGRTREEIRGWKKLDALGQQAVLAESDMRLLVFEAQGRRRYK